MKVAKGRSGVTIIFADITVQETAQRSTTCLMPKVIMKMMTLISVNKTLLKKLKYVLKISFLNRTV